MKRAYCTVAIVVVFVTLLCGSTYSQRRFTVNLQGQINAKSRGQTAANVLLPEEAIYANTGPGIEFANYQPVEQDLFEGYSDRFRKFKLEDITPSWLSFFPCDVYVEGVYAYIAGGHTGLIIFDVSTHTKPVWLNCVDTPGYASSVVVSGGLAFVTDRGEGFHVIDVSTPDSARILGSLDNYGSLSDVAVSGGFAFITDEKEGLHIVDISNPQSPEIVNTVSTEGTALSVVIANGYAFVGDQKPGIHVIDIDPVTSAYIVKTIENSGYTEGFAVSGDRLYAWSSSILRVIDISNYESAEVVEEVKLRSGVIMEWLGDCVLFNSSGELHIVDITIPDSPRVVRELGYLGLNYGSTVSGNLAFVADTIYGLRILDIETPDSAEIVGNFNIPGAVRAMEIEGNYAYIADAAQGFLIMDVSRPETAHIISRVDIPYGVMDIAILNGYAYLASKAVGIAILDINPPASAHEVAVVKPPKAAMSIEIADGYAYVADGGYGLCILDISAPESPRLVGTTDTPGYAWDVTIAGGFAYVADSDGGLQVIDVDPVESASVVASMVTGTSSQSGFPLPDWYSGYASQTLHSTPSPEPEIISDAFKVGNATGRLFLADAGGGIRVYDVTEPQSPVKIESVDHYPDWMDNISIGSMIISDGYAISGGSRGVYPNYVIYDIEPADEAYTTISLPRLPYGCMRMMTIPNPGFAGQGAALSTGHPDSVCYLYAFIEGFRIIKFRPNEE